MKIVFFHDHITTVNNRGLYSSGGLNKKIISRYLKLCNGFSLGTRCDNSKNVEKMTYVESIDNIVFIPIPNLASINLSNYFKAFKIITESIEKTDFVILRFPSLIGFMAAFVSRKKKKGYLIELVGCPRDTFSNYSFFGKLIAFPAFYLTTYFIKNAKNVVYVTDRFLQNRYPSNAINQIGCSDVELVIDRKVLAKRISKINTSDIEKIKIGMLGSVGAKYKGYDTAIKSLDYLKRQGIKNYYLELVGGGNPDNVQKLIKKYNLENQVVLKGTLSHPEGVFGWLDSIDIFIQPSKVEGLPRALTEAMSRACPCIGSNIGGIPELLPIDYMHQKNDFKKLAEIIEKLREKEIMIKQSQYCFNKALEYDKQVLDKKREQFYKTCLYQNCE